jgi:hypothetical protein
MALPDRARQVLQLLHLKGIGQRPLIFIVHSLGGLVVKELLRTAHTQNNPAWKQISARTTGILFLATPHSGAVLATLVDLFRLVTRRNWTIRDLAPHEPHLRDLNEWFRSNFDVLGLRAHVLRESQGIRGLIVVNPSSADPGIPLVRVIPVDKDHINICKPTSRDDHVFLEAKQFIGDCINSTRHPPPSVSDFRGATIETLTVLSDEHAASRVSRGVQGLAIAPPVHGQQPLFTHSLEVREALLQNQGGSSPDVQPHAISISISIGSVQAPASNAQVNEATARLLGLDTTEVGRIESLVNQIDELLKAGRFQACVAPAAELEQLLELLPRRGRQIRDGWITLARLEDNRLHMAKHGNQEIDIGRLRRLYKEAENVID